MGAGRAWPFQLIQLVFGKMFLPTRNGFLAYQEQIQNQYAIHLQVTKLQGEEAVF